MSGQSRKLRNMTPAQDQQSQASASELPCPWCEERQNLSGLDIVEDLHVTCDECEQVYVLASITHEAVCPECEEPRLITAMEVAENAVTACDACRRVFRVADAQLTTYVKAERA